MLNLFDLTNKVAIVTGGYGHLGKSMCEALLDAGAIVIVADLDEKRFSSVFKSIKNIYFEKIDLAKTSMIKSCFENVHKKFGRIDILINSGFYLSANDSEKMTDTEWENGIDGVLNSVFRCIREVIPFMKKSSSGRIINISSMYGVVAPNFKIYQNNESFTNPPNYGVAKAGVIQITKYYAIQLAKYGINVNSICPGPFPSLAVQKSTDFVDELKESNPLKRIGKPEDLKGVTILLSSNASSYITGQNIIVDGGWTIW